MKVDIAQTTLPIPSITTLKKFDLRDCESDDSDSDSDYEWVLEAIIFFS